ncbi:heavy-metal-associated domain-containing protein [Psychroflexus sp. YR1-1]|uniref:Heavy-metal-associated domain-containing protein n=1 Tax=Psychroflexus aurantiacus TaxID=2709310 RepID=A0A6B3R426_9FLAO|nr:heavy metal-associated domain-containing protein [Psychroflexus aurantiacus]NEV94320.1 heavy-metal-associated domain-containing protein [Psychroflexus aurantiacus]
MQTKITVQNLKCGGCANTISKHLNAFEDVSQVNVEAENASVSFAYEKDSTLPKVELKLKQLGYPVAGDTNSYMNKAKSFVSCATGKMNH